MERRRVLLLGCLLAAIALGGGCADQETGGASSSAAGGSSGDGMITIGGFQMVPNPAPDSVREGFVKALADAGYKEGEKVRFSFQNAQGEVSNTQLIAKKFVADRVNMIFAIGTPPLQAAVQAAPKDMPIVFAYASDPWGAGAGTSPTEHLPNTAGTIGTNPVDAEVKLIKEVLPGARRVGLVYNAGESNARYEAKLLKEAAAKEGLEIVEQTVSGPTEVLQAAQSLARKQVDAFGKIGDYATITAFDSLVKAGRESKIPVFSVDQPDIELGAIATIGWSYFDDGYAAGKLAARVLKGEAPGGIPFQPLEKKVLLVNLKAAQDYGVTVPQSVIDRAEKVVR